jgi:peptidoglycan/xylan/chitin deacetylase (PgdA/CDA1 family)
VALTFDDGYADNLHAAKPLLERYDAPATVFVTTGCAGADEGFWWDRLERILLSDAVTEGAGAWNVLDEADPTSRHRLFRQTHHQLVTAPHEVRMERLAALENDAGPAPSPDPAHRALTADEMVELAWGGLVDVGAHTRTHPTLAALPIEDQEREIRGGRDDIQRILGRAPTAFAYPYGTPGSYTAGTVELVRQSGFACACAAGPGLVRRATDAFQLPRLVVRDWDGDVFARHLREWWRG